MRILIIALLVATTAFGQAAQAPTKPIPQQGPPPKNLSVRPDGHVSANQDPANSEKFDVHIVIKGETLSEISSEVMKNSRLWPQLWEQNEHIINPHWIYPQDKILIKPVTPITEAKFEDVYCSGSVRTASLPKNLMVISKFDPSGGVLSVEAEYVYLSQG